MPKSIDAVWSKSLLIAGITLALILQAAHAQQTDLETRERFRRRIILDKQGQKDLNESQVKPIVLASRADMPIAFVDNALLTSGELTEMYHRYLRDNPEAKAVVQSKDNGIQARNQILKKLAGEWAQHTLLLREARRMGVTVSPQEVENAVRETEELFILGDTLEEHLKQKNRSRNDFMRDLEEALTIDKMLTQLVEEENSEKALKEFYSKNKKMYVVPESIYVVTLFKGTRIRMEGPDDSASGYIGAQVHPEFVSKPQEEIDRIRLEMESYRAQSSNLQTFVSLAREHSDPPFNAGNCVIGWIYIDEDDFQGGSSELNRAYVDYMRLTQLTRELDEFYSQLTPGQVSPVHQSEIGYHLAWVVKREPETGNDYESARSQIMAGLKAGKREALAQQLDRQRRVYINFSGIRDSELEALRRRQQAMETGKQ